ncbi:glycosyltransferase family 4 protein [Williamwhitmania taraxaci]|uniref:Glycosyltransferase involved in cell wall bisynthesis n=1 Tax=Williamwhitmania taraxaci TaxID=1640674 RepID=A0A1G6GGS8_9BACT|nr:glycosyltransferase family 4 protein [Williamwhitmania taraxaci]SDB81211.1 Glycosyltransferase involved in cell wall bisynthesis [Williamwhitmania taraxaci]
MSSNPRIVIVSEAFPPDYSGAGLGAQFLAKSLNNKDLLYRVITRTKSRFSDENSPFYIDEIKFYRIVYFQQLLNRVTNNRYLKLLILLLDFPFVFIKTTFFFFRNKNHVDVFFFVSTKWISLVLSFWCVLFKKKYIIETTLLGHDDPIVNTTKKYIWFKRKIKNYQFKNASAVTNISMLLANQCHKFGLPSKKVFTIPYSVNLSKFHSVEYDYKIELKKRLLKNHLSYPIILFTGVLIARKGIDIVYNTFKEILKDYPDAVLIFAGPQGAPGQELHLAEIIRDIKAEGIEKHVVFSGAVTNIEDYFNIADLFFFPSREEGFGRVFIEAMACELPVVTKEIVGITDYIFGNNENGIVVKSEHTTDFVNAIKNVLEDSDLRNTLISNARIKVNTEFSDKEVLNKYLGLFEWVLNTKLNFQD